MSLYYRVFVEAHSPGAEKIVRDMEAQLAKEQPKPSPKTKLVRSKLTYHPPFKQRSPEKFLRNVHKQAEKTATRLKKSETPSQKWAPYEGHYSPGAIAIAKEIEGKIPHADPAKVARSEVKKTMRVARDAIQKRKYAEERKKREAEKARAKAERRRLGLERRDRHQREREARMRSA